MPKQRREGLQKSEEKQENNRKRHDEEEEERRKRKEEEKKERKERDDEVGVYPGYDEEFETERFFPLRKSKTAPIQAGPSKQASVQPAPSRQTETPVRAETGLSEANTGRSAYCSLRITDLLTMQQEQAEQAQRDGDSDYAEDSGRERGMDSKLASGYHRWLTKIQNRLGRRVADHLEAARRRADSPEDRRAEERKVDEELHRRELERQRIERIKGRSARLDAFVAEQRRQQEWYRDYTNDI